MSSAALSFCMFANRRSSARLVYPMLGNGQVVYHADRDRAPPMAHYVQRCTYSGRVQATSFSILSRSAVRANS